MFLVKLLKDNFQLATYLHLQNKDQKKDRVQSTSSVITCQAKTCMITLQKINKL